MFVIEYKQAGIRVMSQELTQSVLARFISLFFKKFIRIFLSQYGYLNIEHRYIMEVDHAGSLSFYQCKQVNMNTTALF